MLDFFAQLTVNALIAGSVYALAACGMTLSYGLLKILNFAHGHLLMIGAYAFFFAFAELGLGFLASSIWTLGFSLLVTVVLFRIFIQPFLRYSFLLVLVTTLGLGYVFEAVVQLLFGAEVHAYPITRLSTSLQLGPVYFTTVQLIIVCASLLVLPLLAFILHGTRVGRRVRAFSEHSEAAQSLGLSFVRYQYGVLIVSAFLATGAGVLVAFDTNMYPTMGTTYTIKAFASMIVGGMGNLWGTIFGAYFLGFLETFGIGLEIGGVGLPASYKDAFAYVVVLLILLLRPEGVFSPGRRRV
ncbi:MAG: branched-chain amino acid ABC transporter permease [Bdellovibrionales bacterium]|nr:branched-chain amino acid ABC transporter permease [Bdellovibrionales bacterium]